MEEKKRKAPKKAATKPPKQQASHEEALAMHKAGKTDKEIAEALGLLNENEASKLRRKHKYTPLLKK
jgi:DNA-binding NarL/FixJ family response regulator